MTRPRFLSRPLLATLVAACLLLAGLAPGVSRVLVASPSGGLHDLCGSVGSPGAPPSSSGGHSHPAACALCVTHGGSHAAPPPAGLAVPVSGAPTGRPSRLAGTASAASAASWLAPPPRAPPVPTDA